jgi:phosphate transport system substrate-binding protein
MKAIRTTLAVLAVTSLSLICGSCGGGGTAGNGDDGDKTVINVTGSDTMVNLAQAWAETYAKVNPDVSIQVAGGGSGVGIAGLIDGFVDVASASRKMKDKESQRAEQKNGHPPVATIVGLDALAVFVHKDSKLDSISVEQLSEI